MSGLGWQDIFKDLFDEQENETVDKKQIRGTKTRVVNKRKTGEPRKPAITLASQIREVARLNELIEELNGNCARHLRDAEKAETEVVNVSGQRNELQRILNNINTVTQFRLDTAFPNSPIPNHDIYQQGPIDAEAISEEEHVLRKLNHMAGDWNLSSDQMGMSPTKRGY